MKTTDKMLIAIVGGIVLLVVVAFVVTLAQPEASYQADDTPEGVAHNYLLALENEEYDRAYSYLSPSIKGYPVSVDKFVKHIHNNAWQFRLNVDTTLAVESAKIAGNSAEVVVRETTFRGSDLFNTGQSSTVFNMDLRMENGVWKIVYSNRYFAWCWGYLDRCN